jgi:hypothetical protein
MENIKGVVKMTTALDSRLHDIAKYVMEKGYKVYVLGDRSNSNPELHFPWPCPEFHFTDGNNIGCCEENDHGLIVSQVLRGANIVRVFGNTMEDLVQKAITNPMESKYTDFEEFAGKRWQWGGFYELEM